MATRDLISQERELFRETARCCVETEIAPHHAQWERDGCVPRELCRKAVAAGLLGCSIPEAYAVAGAEAVQYCADGRTSCSGFTGPGFPVHKKMVMPYIPAFGTEEKKLWWLPPMVRGEVIGAHGITRTRPVATSGASRRARCVMVATMASRARSFSLTASWTATMLPRPKCGCPTCTARLVDECLQMFGGWGSMWEYPIARAYALARIVNMACGPIETMKQIIGSFFKPKKY